MNILDYTMKKKIPADLLCFNKNSKFRSQINRV